MHTPDDLFIVVGKACTDRYRGRALVQFTPSLCSDHHVALKCSIYYHPAVERTIRGTHLAHRHCMLLYVTGQ